MNLNWSNRVIKYVLFVFNLLFVISGIIIIAVGVSVKSYYSDYDIFLNDSYFSLPNLLIATGSLIFFISFFGCCGAIKENWFMIFTFAVLLSVIFILEFSAGIAGYVLRDKTTSFLTDEMQQSMKKYTFSTDKVNAETIMWDTIQEKFQCCGAEGPKDWPQSHKIPTTTRRSSTSAPSSTIASSTTSETTSSSAIQSTTLSSTTIDTNSSSDGKSKRAANNSEPNSENDLPSSCCRSKNGAAGTTVCNLDDTSTAIPYQIGCVDAFGDFIKEHAVTLGGVGIAIAFIQLFGVIFACHLAKQLKHGFYST